jgi:hypothetical protein
MKLLRVWVITVLCISLTDLAEDLSLVEQMNLLAVYVYKEVTSRLPCLVIRGAVTDRLFTLQTIFLLLCHAWFCFCIFHHVYFPLLQLTISCISGTYVYDSETHHLYSIDIHFHSNYITHARTTECKLLLINILRKRNGAPFYQLIAVTVQVSNGGSVMFLSSLPTVQDHIYIHMPLERLQ